MTNYDLPSAMQGRAELTRKRNSGFAAILTKTGHSASAQVLPIALVQRACNLPPVHLDRLGSCKLCRRLFHKV